MNHAILFFSVLACLFAAVSAWQGRAQTMCRISMIGKAGPSENGCRMTKIIVTTYDSTVWTTGFKARGFQIAQAKPTTPGRAFPRLHDFSSPSDDEFSDVFPWEQRLPPHSSHELFFAIKGGSADSKLTLRFKPFPSAIRLRLKEITH